MESCHFLGAQLSDGSDRMWKIPSLTKPEDLFPWLTAVRKLSIIQGISHYLEKNPHADDEDIDGDKKQFINQGALERSREFAAQVALTVQGPMTSYLTPQPYELYELYPQMRNSITQFPLEIISIHVRGMVHSYCSPDESIASYGTKLSNAMEIILSIPDAIPKILVPCLILEGLRKNKGGAFSSMIDRLSCEKHRFKTPADVTECFFDQCLPLEAGRTRRKGRNIARKENIQSNVRRGTKPRRRTKKDKSSESSEIRGRGFRVTKNTNNQFPSKSPDSSETDRMNNNQRRNANKNNNQRKNVSKNDGQQPNKRPRSTSKAFMNASKSSNDSAGRNSGGRNRQNLSFKGQASNGAHVNDPSSFFHLSTRSSMNQNADFIPLDL